MVKPGSAYSIVPDFMPLVPGPLDAISQTPRHVELTLQLIKEEMGAQILYCFNGPRGERLVVL